MEVSFVSVNDTFKLTVPIFECPRYTFARNLSVAKQRGCMAMAMELHEEL